MNEPTSRDGRPALSERDVSYLKLLRTLRGAGGGGDLAVVHRIAAWIDSVRVLDYICGEPRWFADWDVKEALLHNDLCPPKHRLELEKSIAIFDLLRELDHPDLGPDERGEIKEDLKYLFKTLSNEERASVKERAYGLSSSRGGAEGAAAPTAVGPEVPSGSEPAAPAGVPSYSQSLLADELSDFTGASIDDGTVTAAIRSADAAAREVLPPGAPQAAETAGIEPEPVESEVDLEASAGASEAVGAEVGVEVDDDGHDLAEWEALLAKDPEPEPAAVSGEASEDRRELARTATEDSILGMLAYDPQEEVQVALLSNPNLSDRIASLMARRATSRVANALYRERRLFMRPLVQQAMLQSATTPSSALLEIVNSIGNLQGLLDLIRNPKIRFMEVKAKARARLSIVFKAMGAGEKMAAIQRSGRWILKELWTDFFRDEQLVLRCIKERRVDSGTVNEIARSKIAPRKALEAIGNMKEWTSNYQICLELVMNPKTPRQIVTRLIKQLSPADRKMVKNNPALPDSIRRHA